MSMELKDLLYRLLREFSAQTGTIHRLNSEDGHLYMVAVSDGMPEQVLAITRKIPLGKGIAGEAARTAKPVTMCNLQTDQSGVAKPGAKSTGVQAALCVPILNGDVVVGTLGIGRRDGIEFTNTEVDRLVIAGRGVATMLSPTSDLAD